MLRAENIHFAYEHGKVLDGVSFHIRPKEVVSLLGPNGTGKSTLIRILTGLNTPDAGRVILEGRDLSEIPFRERAKMVAYVPQSHRSFLF